jgi:hypothetical protein
MAAAVLLLSGGALFAAGAFNGPGFPIANVNLGSLSATPTGCVIDFTATVRTEAGGGVDSFEVQLFDDGQLIATQLLTATADGQTHDVAGQFQLSGPPGTVTPGVGLYLVDNDQTLDLIDPLGTPCGPLEVPALDRRGIVALAGLLAVASLALLSRRRRA